MTDSIDIGDPFEFFEAQAFGRASKHRFPTHFIREALAIVKGAFGDAWLREQAGRRALGTHLPERDHPLGGFLATAGESQIVEMLELAIYIKRLVKVANLLDVLTAMKDKYAPGFLQLAYAYRFQRAGATKIALEPEAHAGRRADISFALSDQEYLVECYIPKISATDTSQELGYSKGAIFDAIPEGAVMRICIKLKRPINAIDRKRIEQLTVRTIRQMNGQSRLSAEDDAATVSVDDISNIKADTDFPDRLSGEPMNLYGGATWGMAKQMVHRSEIDAIRAGKEYDRSRRSRLFVWQAPQEEIAKPPEERLKEFERKIGDKLAQTRRVDNPRRIVIVIFPDIILQPGENLWKWMSELQRRIMTKHDRVASLLMTYRVWTVNSRYQYKGMWLGGKPEYCVPDWFYKKLNEYEGDFDPLTDWK